MVWTHLLTHGLLCTLIVDGSLFLMMVATSPRVWGYSDYSEAIKAKVEPQTREERRLAIVLAVPWMIASVGFPIWSTYLLKAKLGGEIAFWTAFLNVFALVLGATLGDLVLLDWLVVNKITPKFVMIPGTEKGDYADFSHHYKGHARAVVPLIAVCAVLAGIVTVL